MFEQPQCLRVLAWFAFDSGGRELRPQLLARRSQRVDTKPERSRVGEPEPEPQCVIESVTRQPASDQPPRQRQTCGEVFPRMLRGTREQRTDEFAILPTRQRQCVRSRGGCTVVG